MTTVKLTDNTEVKVGCKHGFKDIDLWEHAADGTLARRAVACRCTEAWVLDPDGKTLARAEAVCSPHDNFCKRTGRLLAARRLIQAWEYGPHGEDFVLRRKADRAAVLRALCPECAPGPKVPSPKRVLREVHEFLLGMMGEPGALVKLAESMEASPYAVGKARELEERVRLVLERRRS